MRNPRLVLGGASLALLALLAWTVASSPRSENDKASSPTTSVPIASAIGHDATAPAMPEPDGLKAKRRPKTSSTSSGKVAVARPTPAPAVPAAAGMLVAIDPETGELGMPTAEQLAELEAQLSPQTLAGLNHSSEGLVQTHHPEGHVSIDLEGRFQEFAIARIGADGKPVFGCVHDLASLRRAVQGPAPKAQPALEEK